MLLTPVSLARLRAIKEPNLKVQNNNQINNQSLNCYNILLCDGAFNTK